MRRYALALVMLLGALAFAACGGGSASRTATPAPRLTATSAPSPAATHAGATAALSPAASGSPGAATDEVTGIVGSVIDDGETRGLEITHLSGADVTQIAVSDRTVIRKAGGGRETLGEIRSSDRVIASGVARDDGVLEADEITVQQVGSGGSPGG